MMGAGLCPTGGEGADIKLRTDQSVGELFDDRTPLARCSLVHSEIRETIYFFTKLVYTQNNVQK